MAQSYNSLIAKNTDTQQHSGARTSLPQKNISNSMVLHSPYLSISQNHLSPHKIIRF